MVGPVLIATANRVLGQFGETDCGRGKRRPAFLREVLKLSPNQDRGGREYA